MSKKTTETTKREFISLLEGYCDKAAAIITKKYTNHFQTLLGQLKDMKQYIDRDKFNEQVLEYLAVQA